MAAGGDRPGRVPREQRGAAPLRQRVHARHAMTRRNAVDQFEAQAAGRLEPVQSLGRGACVGLDQVRGGPPARLRLDVGGEALRRVVDFTRLLGARAGRRDHPGRTSRRAGRR